MNPIWSMQYHSPLSSSPCKRLAGRCAGRTSIPFLHPYTTTHSYGAPCQRQTTIGFAWTFKNRDFLFFSSYSYIPTWHGRHSSLPFASLLCPHRHFTLCFYHSSPHATVNRIHVVVTTIITTITAVAPFRGPHSLFTMGSFHGLPLV